MPLTDALAALGGNGTMGRRHDVVALAAMVGSASRAVDFDADFQLINPALRGRREGLSAMLRAGFSPRRAEVGSGSRSGTTYWSTCLCPRR